jgi:alpha-ketoglutarate-dependent taurine dioxygenase
MIGRFIEQAGDRHVSKRDELLESARDLPAPAVTGPRAGAADFFRDAADSVLGMLKEHGIGLVRLDEPLTDEAYLRLGELLGRAMPETAQSVRQYVSRDVILNLVAAHGRIAEDAKQPFSTTALTLHTEGSGRPANRQPRYIVLMCCEPGDDATSAQTVLVPMAAVERRLGENAAVLPSVRYRDRPGVPPVARREEDRLVFSFRDFHGRPLEWETDGDYHADQVNGALRGLLDAMYDTETVTGVHWTRGSVVIIDNRRYFHGRTAGKGAGAIRKRHLKRLRIVD